MRYAAVIAAAGLSSRMGAFKPLLPLGDTTVIGRVIDNLRQAGVDEIAVCVGRDAPEMRTYLSAFDVNVCENPEYASSEMYDSLMLGLSALQNPYDAVFLTPGDVPLVSPSTIWRMENSSARCVRPICDGHGGHPVLVSAEVASRLLSCDGSWGLRGALSVLGEVPLDIEVDDRGCVMDVDTPDDFQEISAVLSDDEQGLRR